MNRIRKGDLVQVISGGQDKGKQGKVLKIFQEENRAIVEGVRLVKKHQKASEGGGPSGIVEKSLPIHMSNLMPVDSKTMKPSRVRFEIRSEGKRKEKVRICTRSGEAVQNVEAKA